MRGLELSRRFWQELLRPAIERESPELLPYLAAGLCGAGSDCLGYDDEVSRDHAFAAGCMLFVPESLDREKIFRLSAIYDRLPRSFLGFDTEHRSRQGDGRYGVKTMEGFFRPLTGSGARRAPGGSGFRSHPTIWPRRRPEKFFSTAPESLPAAGKRFAPACPRMSGSKSSRPGPH